MAAKFPEDSEAMSDGMLTCLICTEPFQNPKVLPCHHTFCSPCLEKYFHTFHKEGTAPPTSFPCPICRQPVPVPDDGFQGDKEKDAQMGQIHHLVEKISTHKKVHCDVCKYRKQETSARDHCTACSINYCEHCSKDHHKHTLFTNHSVIPVNQMDSSSLKCETHDAEHVRYFCTTCLAPLCTVCAVTDHVNHKTVELTAALGNKKKAVQDKIEGMSDKVMKQEEMLAQLEDIHSVKEAAMKKTKLEIERHVSGLIAQLLARKNVLLDDLDGNHQAAIKQINLEKENCNFALANMKSLWKFAAKLTEPSQSLQLLAMHGDLAKMVDAIIEAPDPRLPKECTTMTMFMPKEHMSIGELQKCEVSKELIRKIAEVGDIRNGVDGPSSPQSPQAPLPAHYYYEPMTIKWQPPRLCWKVDKVGQKTGEINEAYDVTITPNGTVIVAEWLNQRLQIFDSTGFSKDIIGQGQIQPWGISLTREGNLAVSDEKDRTIKVLSPTGEILTHWKKLMFGWPRGVAVNQAGQFIISDTQHGKHTVSIHLSDGQCIRQFGSQGSGNEQFHWPRYVTVDHQDRIIVSDGSNHCIKVLDPTGQFLFKFGSIGSNDGQMKHPRGVCVDPNDNILVADQDNHRVTLYSPDGKFMRHILSVQKPWGIAVSEGGLLAVTQKPALLLYKVFDPMP